jgi:voltage-gated potassium channel
MESVKLRVYQILTDPPEGDRVGGAFSTFIFVLIAVNVLATVLETVRSLGEPYAHVFYAVEVFSVAVFSIEYVLRLWSCTSAEEFRHPVRGRVKVATQIMPVVDLLAILPFYLQVLIPGLDLRFVRALRLFRIFRVFRAGRLAEAIRILTAVLRSRREEILASFVVIMIVVVLAANVMYLLEHHAQPEVFSSVPAAMWWAIVTVTTIGYGDVVPHTAVGRFMGGVMALLGIVMLALPVGVLGSGFVEEVERRRGKGAGDPPPGTRVCPHCGRPIATDGDSA